MNNWRLLLLAVVAILLPVGSFTETNFIDGRQECCDHRSKATQESSLYGNYRKATPGDRRLNSQPLREESRRLQVRGDSIVPSRARSVLRTEGRDIHDSSSRFSRDQEIRLRSANARDYRQAREDVSRRTREDIARNPLNFYERDALGSRRTIRMARDDARIGRVATSTVRDSRDHRRKSATRETTVLQRNRSNVARQETRRDTRIGLSRFEDKVQNNNERRSLDRRVREISDETRRFRSMETRQTRERMETRRSSIRGMPERVDEQRRETRERTFSERGTFERSAAELRPEVHSAVEREDRSSMLVRKNRINERMIENRQHRNVDANQVSQGRREARLNTERRLSHDSRNVDGTTRLRIVRNDDRTETRREAMRLMERASRERTNERRQNSQTENSRILKIARNDETKEDRSRDFSRTLDKQALHSSMSRSNLREARISVRPVMDERAAVSRRDMRSVDRFDERREQRYETQMSRSKQMNLRESRNNYERRQDSRRSVSPSRIEVNTRTERETRTREIQDYERSDVSDHERGERIRDQTLTRLSRVTERRNEVRLSRNTRSAERATDDRRVSMIRDNIRRERSNVHRDVNDETRERVVARRLTRDISTPAEKIKSRKTLRIVESESRQQRARTLEDTRGERRDVRVHEESRLSRDRVSQTRASEERILTQRRENRESRIDTRIETIRNRGPYTERSEARNNNENRVLQRQTRDIRGVRSVERRSRQAIRDVESRTERLSMSRDERRVNERDVRNVRDHRNVESRRESRMMEYQVQPSRRFTLEHMDRDNSDVKFEAKLRSSENRREIDTRFRNFVAKAREADVVDETYGNENTTNWQMVFYTLQGVYLCGLLIQILTEKSNKGKTRNFSWWSSAKKLIKVD